MEIYEKLIREYSTEPILEEALGSFFYQQEREEAPELGHPQKFITAKGEYFFGLP